MYEAHPAADMLPMQDSDRFESLKDSIERDGLQDPIILFDGAILDGRNRFKACQELGIDPHYKSVSGIDPYAFVRNSNLERRDMSAQQRYLIWKRLGERSAEFQAEIAKRKAEANKARSEAAKKQHETSNPRAGEKSGSATSCGDTKRDHEAEAAQKSATAKAKASKTNRGAVESMDQLDRKRPDLADQVAGGTMKPAQAMKQMRNDELPDVIAEIPSDQYRVIYADPPWKYGDDRSSLSGYTGAEAHYPTMSVADICALDVKSMRADDAVLFLWATFPLLPDALKVVKAWGFKYKTAVVWNKDAWNVGHYHDASAELLIIGTHGSCAPADIEKDEANERLRGPRIRQVQAFSRLEHSRKPEEFRELVDLMYPLGPRVELFRRGEAPKGWAVWGNESK